LILDIRDPEGGRELFLMINVLYFCVDGPFLGDSIDFRSINMLRLIKLPHKPT